MADPLQQFEIREIVPIHVGGVNISFTNSSMWMVITVLFISAFFIFFTAKGEMKPGRWQSLAEAIFEFIAKLLKENVGDEGKKYFPFVFTLFNFILVANMLGLIPFSFTSTSHIIVTFVMAFTIFIMITIVGFARHGLHFFSYFVPAGVPKLMIPFMLVIEIISYLSRPISLSVRLFANMMAGHIMIKIFAGFVFGLGAATFGIGGLLPLAMDVVLYGFEVLVAFLQAYVFVVLTCLYLHDAVHLH